MSYQPLHLKYRPQVLSDCIGQDPIVRTLTNALQNQRLAPAYLFFGGRGTGKTSTARIFAKSLNCLASGKPTANPCNRCKLCVDISQGNSVDVSEIDAATNTGVESIRKISDSTQLAPVESRYKIIIIDEVHMLSNQSFNALLKTLEDFKNDKCIFILATTDPQKIPETVASRCQTFNFRQIGIGDILGWLTEISQKEQINVDADALKVVAKLSNGGMRDALVMLDQIALNDCDGSIDRERVKQILGVVSTEIILNIVSAIVNSQVDKIIDGIRSLIEQGKDCVTIINTLGQFYIDALKAKTIDKYDEKTSNIDEPTWDKVKSLIRDISIQSLVAAQKEIKSLQSQIRDSSQPQLCLEIGVLGLMPVDPIDRPVAPAVIPQSVPTVTAPQSIILKPVEHPEPIEALPDLDSLLPKSEIELAIFNIKDLKIKALFATSIQSANFNWQDKKAMVSVRASEAIKNLIVKHRQILEESVEVSLMAKFQIVFVFV